MKTNWKTIIVLTCCSLLVGIISFFYKPYIDGHLSFNRSFEKSIEKAKQNCRFVTPLENQKNNINYFNRLTSMLGEDVRASTLSELLERGFVLIPVSIDDSSNLACWVISVQDSSKKGRIVFETKDGDIKVLIFNITRSKLTGTP